MKQEQKKEEYVVDKYIFCLYRNKIEELLKKKAESKNPKKKNNKMVGVEAAKKAVEERQAKNKNKKAQQFDL